MKVLVTGGTGYIGSHTCVELLKSGHDVVVVDNLSNSSPLSLQRIKTITGHTPEFHEVDVLDVNALRRVFSAGRFDAVIHLAGLKSVGESVAYPLRYYQKNVGGALALCEVLTEFSEVRNLVFSSSATVYGEPNSVPIREDFPLAPTNPYGRSKQMVEDVLRDLHASQPGWNIALLRYFNPVGAHESGLLGEDPNEVPNNLMPFISQVAVGKLKELSVFGNDYDTPDGTGVRDYIHVMDLAAGHVKALEKLAQNSGLITLNLGTGRGYSVLEMVTAFEQASGKPVPYRVVPRRPGDIPVCYADPSLAQQVLGWEARHGLPQMCEDAWRWQSHNPSGFRE